MITNYWFPAIPVFPDVYEPEVKLIPDLFCEKGASVSLPLNDFVSDKDNMAVSIVKSVVNNTSPEIFEAEVINGQLVITSIPGQAGEGTVTVCFNSNGKIVNEEVHVTVGDAATATEPIDPEPATIVYSNRNLSFVNCEGYHVWIFNLQGLKVAEIQVENKQYSRNLALSRGVYIVYAQKGNKIIAEKINVR